METDITIHKIGSRWEFAAHRGSVSTWRGGVGREMGERFRGEGI